VVGLTVVAFGTSAPEVAVTTQGVLAGQPDLAVGNVVGSNIANVLLILGLSAIITPLVVAQQLARLDIPLMIGVSVLVLVLALDRSISRVEGGLLFVGIVAYTIFAIRQSRKESQAIQSEYAQEFAQPAPKRGSQAFLNVAGLILGLVLIVLGARWLVAGATALARTFGVSELIIGLTVIAVGTSLPEIATSVVASLRGERDIAVGNVVGSNLFNLLSVLGIAGILATDGIAVSDAVLRFDLPVMLAAAVACLPIFAAGNMIARWQGVLFVAYYVVYTAYLVLAATEHDALPVFSTVLWAFVLPLTAATLFIIAWRTWHKERRSALPLER
jgi:cation:H+ antiporter